jgi:UDP-GlcNAc:undecaprenyl-phosphate/decaprenyl-phosphate GlcNAc-1-phosphate transferase
MILFPTLILSLLITIGMIPFLKTTALHFNAVDFPNPRKVHSRPMPKVGGVAMAFGAIVPILIWSPSTRFVDALLMGAGVLVVFGFMDDLKEMDYRTKLVGQIIAALIVMQYGGLSISCMGDCLPEGAIIPAWFSAPLTLFIIVGVTNAINLSDGLDGLAGGISMMMFICLGVMANQNSMTASALLAGAVIGAIFGFLRFNTHPAVIFMGDAGSQLLGFIAVTLSLYISQTSEPISRTFPILLLGFPILDTLTVMMERIRKGVSPFKADKNHFHHKLLRLGLQHAEAVVVIYTLQFLVVLSAFLLRFHSEWTLLLIYLVFSGTILLCFHWADKNEWKVPRRDFLDKLIIGYLANVYIRQMMIKGCFGALELGTPLLLFTCCLVMEEVPPYVGVVTLALLVALVGVRLLHRAWNISLLRLILFVMIPYLVFIAHLQLPQLVSAGGQVAFHLSFGLVAFLAVLTLKFTRRQKGFKANPFDFLIILVSFLVTSIPEVKNTVADASLVTAKMITLFFAFEVLLGEIREKVFRLNLFMVFSLGTVFVKSLL